MKDSEFIELLNLYLDHEITPEDAVRLEAEVQSDPKRRRTYHEYCRMQKACALIAQNPEAVSEADQGDLIAFEPNRSWSFTAYAAGLCAAAACVALVLIARNRVDSSADRPGETTAQSVTGAQPLAVNDSSQLRPIARTISVTPRTSGELKPAFTAAAFAVGENQTRAETILPSTDARFEWMNRVQLTSLNPVPAEELVFDAKASPGAESRTFRSHRPIDIQVERTAFQFQR
jgi:anti-sigma factor RsiW